MCVTLLIHSLIGVCVGAFLSSLQVNQYQTKVIPCEKAHLTVQTS